MYKKYKMITKRRLLKQVKQLGVLDADAIEIIEAIEFRKNKKREGYKASIKLFIDKSCEKIINLKGYVKA